MVYYIYECVVFGDTYFIHSFSDDGTPYLTQSWKLAARFDKPLELPGFTETTEIV